MNPLSLPVEVRVEFKGTRYCGFVAVPVGEPWPNSPEQEAGECWVGHPMPCPCFLCPPKGANLSTSGTFNVKKREIAPSRGSFVHLGT